jgi:hypothetical protein
MNLNLFKKTMILLVALSQITAATENANKPPLIEPEYTIEEKTEYTIKAHVGALKKREKPECRRGLIRAFGLMGRKTPSTDKLQICPQVEFSCCQNADQLYIIQSVQADLKSFKERVNIQYQVVKDMISELLVLDGIGEKMKARLAKRRLTNCKIILSKLSLFNLKEIAVDLDQAMKDMHNFLEISYKGFFCTVCDAQKHVYFNPNYKSLVLNFEFCRKTMVHTIKVLQYLHGHLTKYSNMAVQFAGYCDIRGKLTDEPIDQKLIFTHSMPQNQIKKCWKGMNHPFWIYDCQDFCQNLNIVTLPEFFEPNIKQFMLVTNFLKLRNKELLFQESREPLLNLPEDFTDPNPKPVKVTQNERVLAQLDNKQSNSKSNSIDSSGKNSTNGTNQTSFDEDLDQGIDGIDYSEKGIKLMEKRLAKREIISASLGVANSGEEGSRYDLKEFVPSFHEMGMNFYETGKSSIINMDIYLQISEAIKIMSKGGDPNKETTDDHSRRLKNASLLQFVILLILSSLIH